MQGLLSLLLTDDLQLIADEVSTGQLIGKKKFEGVIWGQYRGNLRKAGFTTLSDTGQIRWDLPETRKRLDRK